MNSHAQRRDSHAQELDSHSQAQGSHAQGCDSHAQTLDASLLTVSISPGGEIVTNKISLGKGAGQSNACTQTGPVHLLVEVSVLSI